MIPEIKNAILRRVALVFTVAAVIVCLGPAALIKTALRWVEDECEIDLREIWKESK